MAASRGSGLTPSHLQQAARASLPAATAAYQARQKTADDITAAQLVVQLNSDHPTLNP